MAYIVFMDKDFKPHPAKKLKTHKIDVKGKTAPTEAPETADPKDTKVIETIIPSEGFALCRLVNPKEREAIGFSKDSKAFQSAALVEVIRYATGDDHMETGFPAGTLVFVSLEEIAPLLNTFHFLIPYTRFMGHIPTGVLPKKPPMGFQLNA